jgi:cobalt-zinc-cadmium efflux system protein
MVVRMHPHAGHSHHHAHDHVASSKKLGVATAITVAFVFGEAIAGWLGQSLALLSDAGHNLADAGALALSWYALRLSAKRSHERMTFGYHRVAVFAALVNVIGLVVIAVAIGWEGIARIRAPQAPSGALMIGVATAAIAVNVWISLSLHADAKHDINIRSAYLHMIGDAISAAGVVIAGVLVAMFQSVLADPVVSLLIAAFILVSGYGVFRETLMVLLEGTPSGIDMSDLVSAIRGVGGVLDVHDLHVWMIGPRLIACSCHILVAEQSVREGQQVLRSVVHEIEHRFQITHTTIQVEVEGCEANDMYCTGSARPTLNPSGASGSTRR